MKTTFMNGLLIALVAGSLIACKKEKQTSDIVEKGSWKIKLYSDNGTDETYHFSGYTFSFEENGTLTANKSGVVVTGTWSASGGLHDDELVLNFGTTEPFEELNDDWHILKKESKIIELQDVSGDGDIDLLTFERL